MPDITHRFVETNGIRMHIAEAGEGPLVILCHGFPESWYSWRHQLTALAEAGYHAVAPDQRGYGQTDAPAPVEAYTQLHLVGDIIGLADALGEERFAVAGHDWGAPVAWHTALLRPDRVRGVIGLSVAYSSRGTMGTTANMKKIFGDNFFYILYFQAPGVAEHELQRDPRRTMRMTLFSASGDSPRGARAPLPKTMGFLDGMTDPETLPAWLSEADLDYFTAEFQRAGFRGGLNWYRNIDRNQELMGPWNGAKVLVPALYIVGESDVTIGMSPNWEKNLRASVADLREVVTLPGAGHWTQQERPAEVNTAMLRFLATLPA